ncbi:MmcQ/YjbR family DNA-binding protein [Spiroplasma sp. DGKH1]|uniref:MmcQ/YjbR family DNA-binding protein n=1 Tax=Spiroplasma sp. DGKH1 TaxID=3050074 RepID=UPI0034C66E4A
MELALSNLEPSLETLSQYGFSNNQDGFILTKSLGDNLNAIIKIDKDFAKIKVDVLDSQTTELFQPFYTKITTNYSNHVKTKVNDLVKEILDTCFTKIDHQEKLLKYCQETFPTVIEKPWKKWPEYQTVKATYNNKWYALFMNVPYYKLQPNSTNTSGVEILNLKLDPQVITTLLDNKIYFKGYHMNHKTWISILLNKQTDLNKVKELINESYYNVTKQK